jgi:hypothetical protein
LNVQKQESVLSVFFHEKFLSLFVAFDSDSTKNLKYFSLPDALLVSRMGMAGLTWPVASKHFS